MTTGDPSLRNKTFVDPNSGEARALSFRCFDRDFSGRTAPFAPGMGYDSVEFPKEKCAGGIRANIYFPTFVMVFFVPSINSRPFLDAGMESISIAQIIV